MATGIDVFGMAPAWMTSLHADPVEALLRGVNRSVGGGRFLASGTEVSRGCASGNVARVAIGSGVYGSELARNLEHQNFGF